MIFIEKELSMLNKNIFVRIWSIIYEFLSINL